LCVVGAASENWALCSLVVGARGNSANVFLLEVKASNRGIHATLNASVICTSLGSSGDGVVTLASSSCRQLATESGAQVASEIIAREFFDNYRIGASPHLVEPFATSSNASLVGNEVATQRIVTLLVLSFAIGGAVGDAKRIARFCLGSCRLTANSKSVVDGSVLASSSW
jgi:hypothetical protein